MSDTTTIRIDRQAHQRLVAISRESGHQLMTVVREAIDALERERFGSKVAAEWQALRQDQTAWAEYVADAELAVADGID